MRLSICSFVIFVLLLTLCRGNILRWNDEAAKTEVENLRIVEENKDFKQRIEEQQSKRNILAKLQNIGFTAENPSIIYIDKNIDKDKIAVKFISN